MSTLASPISDRALKTQSIWLSHLNLIFSIAFAIFVLGPPFLGFKFAPYPLIHIADVFDIFTPLVLIPLYWLLFRTGEDRPASVRETLIFLVFAACWVLGQGMHLSANSINNLIHQSHAESGDIFNLTNFYDEYLGHYLWHLGVMGLSAVLIYREWRKPVAAVRTAVTSHIVSGLIYGFVFFAMVVEGNTVPMGLPFAVLAILFILVWQRAKIRQPLYLLFLSGYGLAIVLFAVWGIWQHGFPGFFDAGLFGNH